MGKSGLELRLSAQAGGPHDSPLRQIFQGIKPVRDKGVSTVRACHDDSQLERVWHVNRNVFEGVNSQVSSSIEQGIFKLFDKQSLATHLG